MNQAQITTHPLRSPWDVVGHPRSKGLYDCPETIHIAPDLTVEGFYSDTSYSIVDPDKYSQYEKATSPAFHLVNDIASAADTYRLSGNDEAARCAVRQLIAAAHDRALSGDMLSKQANYVQGWIVGALAVDYLKIRPGTKLLPSDQRLIENWLRNIAEQTLAYYAQQKQIGGTDARNNHVYWAAMEIAAIAIAVDDRSLWSWSISVYREGVAEIAPDGTLPLEILRKQRALHYHLFASSPLVMLAELGCANDLNLYLEHDRALPRLVNRSLGGLIDNKYFAARAGAAQDSPRGLPTAEEVGWAKPFLERFPDEHFLKLLASAPSLSYQFTGGLPPPARTLCRATKPNAR